MPFQVEEKTWSLCVQIFDGPWAACPLTGVIPVCHRCKKRWLNMIDNIREVPFKCRSAQVPSIIDIYALTVSVTNICTFLDCRAVPEAAGYFQEYFTFKTPASSEVKASLMLISSIMWRCACRLLQRELKHHSMSLMKCVCVCVRCTAVV